MDCLVNLSGCELVTLAAILSVSISQNLSSEEIDTLGNFFSALGENLSTIGSAMSSPKLGTQSCNFSSEQSKKTIQN